MKSKLRPLTRAAVVVLLAASGAAVPESSLMHSPAPQKWHAPVQVWRNGDGTVARGDWNQTQSSNWSGYVLPYYLSSAPYTSAQMTWTVPSVIPQKGGTQYSANWVGIGGFCITSTCSVGDNTLIQLGTEQDVSRSGANYYAWYEMLPAAEVPLGAGYPVVPGDIMTATLMCTSNCSSGATQTWALTMSDTAPGTSTPRWQWGQSFTYASSLASAEWIEEAPFSGTVLPLADFVTANFQTTFGANGATPSLSLANNGIQMADPHGQTSNPSMPNASEAFNACWGSRTYTICPPPQ